MHGFMVAPPPIFIQLHRFHKIKGRIIKNHVKAQIDSSIKMPVFRIMRHQVDSPE